MLWLLTGSIASILLAFLLGFYLMAPTSDTLDLTIEAEFSRDKMAGKSAFIVGYTGEVGKELLKEVCRSKIFAKVVLLGRRKVQLDPDLYPNIVQHEIDFNNFESHKNLLEGVEVGFCALGTTRKTAGVEGFRQVDHDYVLAVANVAKSAGVKDFNLISSQGANAASPFLYPQVKGQTEADVKLVGFERLSIYRPAILLCDRQERRIPEKIFIGLLKPVTWVAPKFITVPTVTVAKAMIANLWRSNRSPGEILDNSAIHQLGEEFQRRF